MPEITPVTSIDTELWKTDNFLKPIEGKIETLRLLSVDVFDTLLFRCCSQPSDVFLQAGRQAKQIGLLADGVTPETFRTLRITAERQARALDPLGCGEITLEHIYAQLPAGVCDASRVKELELEAERELCYLNPHMSSLIRFCQQRRIEVALVSDMYMSPNQLSSILKVNGFDPIRVDAILVSSIDGGGKSSGKLFDVLLEAFPGIKPGDVLHIGDNVAADVDGAASRGIRSIHYPVIPETLQSPLHWESIRHGDVAPAVRSIRKLATAAAPDKLGEKENFFYRFGAAVLGPFLQGFCDWILDICEKSGRTAVFPFMREAHLLGPMLERCASMRGLPIKVAPLYVSRQATLLAAMNDFGGKELDKVLALGGITLHELFRLLGLEEDTGQPVHSANSATQLKSEALNASSFAPYLTLTVPESRNIRFAEATSHSADGESVFDALRRYLLQEDTLERIRHTIAAQRSLLVGHIRQQYGGEPDKLITVDIGFNGTIQSALQAALDNENITHDTIHLMAVGTDKAAEWLLRGLDIRCFIGGGGEHSELAKRFARSPGFTEELMMGDFGSTLRYERQADGRIAPVLAELVHPPEEFRCKEACHEGVFAFQRYYDYLRQEKPKVTGTLGAREWSLILHRAIDMPTPEEAAGLGGLTHQDNYGGVSAEPICGPIPEQWLERGSEFFIDMSNFGPKTLNVYWPQGTATRYAPFYLYGRFARQADAFGGRMLLFHVMNRLTEADIRTVHLFGTGSVADMLIREAQLHGIRVRGVIDPAASPSNRQRGPFEPISLAEAAAESDNHVYVIASLTDISEFKALIEERYADLRPDKQPKLFEPFA